MSVTFVCCYVIHFWNVLEIFVWPPFNVIFFSLYLLFVCHKGGDGYIRHYNVFAFGVKSMTKYGQKSLMTTEPPSDSLLLCFKASLMATWKLHAQWSECQRLRENGLNFWISLSLFLWVLNVNLLRISWMLNVNLLRISWMLNVSGK